MTRAPLIPLIIAAFGSAWTAFAIDSRPAPPPDTMCRAVRFLKGGGVIESSVRYDSLGLGQLKPLAQSTEGASTPPAYVDDAGRIIVLDRRGEECAVTIDERGARGD